MVDKNRCFSSFNDIQMQVVSQKSSPDEVEEEERKKSESPTKKPFFSAERMIVQSRSPSGILETSVFNVDLHRKPRVSMKAFIYHLL